MGDLRDRMMSHALKEAKAGLTGGELPIGAIVALGDRIVAEARTCEKAERRYLVHADLLALQQADLQRPSMQERRQMTLYVTLEPCMMCLGAAMSFFIGEVVYALESPGDGAVKRVVPHWQPDENFPAYRLPNIIGGIGREESRQLFADYAETAPRGGFRTWALSLAAL